MNTTLRWLAAALAVVVVGACGGKKGDDGPDKLLLKQVRFALRYG